ncbi:MAG: hypothetical protein IJ904_07855 [Candidatus Methanomethylophilaceae archaeon]|nr:hypothetical protein [Candidatus Methanomethylophilaceae archaeon]MBR6881392.1 hypothetical protein [Bacteroidales bacterium]
MKIFIVRQFFEDGDCLPQYRDVDFYTNAAAANARKRQEAESDDLSKYEVIEQEVNGTTPSDKKEGPDGLSLKEAVDKGLAQIDALLGDVGEKMVTVIKGILRNLVDTRNGVMLDVSDYYEAGFMERIGKYAYCGDYPANFILTRFGLDSQDGIMVDGVDIDEDRSLTFFRDDLDFPEVRAIYGMLLDIESGISCGVMSVDDEGFIRV